MSYSHVKALLIDIDDTVVRFKPGATAAGRAPSTGSLLQVLHAAGTTLGGLTAEETTRRIAQVKAEMRWWHWSDFIVALGLRPKEFWQYAFETERHYLEPAGPEMRAALERLNAAGLLLYVASNNPSSGILHKLRVAGLATINGSTLFRQLLGATELQAMKSEPRYWQKALAHTAHDAGEVAVLGDNPHDDCEVPRSVGIKTIFLIDRANDRSAENTREVTYVRDFSQIADLLLGATGEPRRAPRVSAPRRNH